VYYHYLTRVNTYTDLYIIVYTKSNKNIIITQSDMGDFMRLIILGLFIMAPFLNSCGFRLNFHVVEEGKVYRSAQPTANDLQNIMEKYHIKTILNLRGGSASDWYKEEKEFAEKNGIDLITIGMSAMRLPHRKDLIKVLDTFKNARYPILIHCKAGADRTGEASAMYQIDYMDKTNEEAASNMLRVEYHHLKWFTPAKDYFIRKVYKGETWARESYYPCSANYKYYNKKDYCTKDIRIEDDLNGDT